MDETLSEICSEGGEGGLTVSERKVERGISHMVQKNMKVADDRSRGVVTQCALMDSLSSLEDYLRAKTEELAIAVSRGVAPPKFFTGQSVHQWWAPWMAQAPLDKLPGTYAQRKRPSWFKAEVLAIMPEPMDIVYSGILWTSVFTYRAH